MVGIFSGLGAGFERGSAAALGAGGLLGASSLGRGGEGVFLNAATGNWLLSRQDEFLAGRGPDAAIARTCNSLGQASLDDNGDLWRQSTDRRVYGLTGTLNTTGSTIKRVSADGSEITYGWNGSYYATTDGAGAHDKLSFTAAVTGPPAVAAYWTWTDGSSQIRETYEASEVTAASWRIRSQTDLDANALTFAYLLGTDKLDKVTTANGDYTQYTWSGWNITSIVTKYTNLQANTPNQTLTRVYYAYDAQNRLIQVKVDLSPEDNVTTDSNIYLTNYEYVGTTNRVSRIYQGDGSELLISYDASNRVSRLVQAVAAGDSRTTDISYDDVALRTDIKVYTQQYVNGATPSLTTSLFYNSSNQLTKIIAPPASSTSTAQQLEYAYDSKGT